VTATQTAGSPALYAGPFNTAKSLGIDRGNYIAVHSNNPAGAARYAVENMGSTSFTPTARDAIT
jgi:hypothetical protein